MDRGAAEAEGHPLVQFRHPDGCVSRFSAETKYALIERPDEREPTIVLEEGPSWHYCVPGGLTHEIHLPGGVLEIRAATALAVCAGEQPSLVAAVTGDVVLRSSAGSSLVVPESAVARLGPDQLEIAAELSLGELAGVGWLQSNLALDVQAAEPDAAPDPVAEAAVVTVAPEQPPPESGEPGQGSLRASRPWGPLPRALPWFLVGTATLAAVATAVVAAVESPVPGPQPVASVGLPNSSVPAAPGPGSLLAGPAGPGSAVTVVPAPLPPGPAATPPVPVPATPPKPAGGTVRPLPPPYASPPPYVAATGCRRQGPTLSMVGSASGRSGQATRIEIVAQFVDSNSRIIAEADSVVTVPGYGSVGWTASTSSGSAGSVSGCHLRGYRILH